MLRHCLSLVPDPLLSSVIYILLFDYCTSNHSIFKLQSKIRGHLVRCSLGLTRAVGKFRKLRGFKNHVAVMQQRSSSFYRFSNSRCNWHQTRTVLTLPLESRRPVEPARRRHGLARCLPTWNPTSQDHPASGPHSSFLRPLPREKVGNTEEPMA